MEPRGRAFEGDVEDDADEGGLESLAWRLKGDGEFCS